MPKMKIVYNFDNLKKLLSTSYFYSAIRADHANRNEINCRFDALHFVANAINRALRKRSLEEQAIRQD